VSAVQETGLRELARIGAGLVALVGFGVEDAPAADAADGVDERLRWMAGKLADLRLFPSPDFGSSFDRSLRDTGGGLLVVSQFTLYGDASKGRRPDFGAAAPYERAHELYKRFCKRCDVELPDRVGRGAFGAPMEVALVNDGPVTLWLER